MAEPVTVGHLPKMKSGACILALALLAPPARADCPTSVPVDGTACSGTDACEYGGDAYGLCSTFATCTVGIWKVYAAEAGCGTNAADCPAFGAVTEGAICPLADHTSLCVYANGVCSCPAQCFGANSVLEWAWACRPWLPAQTGCPGIRPRLGTACSQEGQWCSWSGCCGAVPLGPDEKCSDAGWTADTIDCACGGPAPGCAFAPITPDGGIADASPSIDAGAEPEDRVVGCGCQVPQRSTDASSFVAIALSIVGAVRRRVRRSNRRWTRWRS